MTGAVTPWISVATPPLADRPGEYEVAFGGTSLLPVRTNWDGSRWATNGCYYPRAGWGDVWRGLAAPSQG